MFWTLHNEFHVNPIFLNTIGYISGFRIWTILNENSCNKKLSGSYIQEYDAFYNIFYFYFWIQEYIICYIFKNDLRTNATTYVVELLLILLYTSLYFPERKIILSLEVRVETKDWPKIQFSNRFPIGRSIFLNFNFFLVQFFFLRLLFKNRWPSVCYNSTILTLLLIEIHIYSRWWEQKFVVATMYRKWFFKTLTSGVELKIQFFKNVKSVELIGINSKIM